MKVGLKIKGIDEAIWNCGKPLVEKAMRQMLKTLGTRARTQISKLIRKEYNLKKRDLDKQIVVKPQLNNYQVSLNIRGKKIPLIEFGAKPTKRGVSILIKKGRGRVVIPHTFEATMTSGHIGIFERKVEGGIRAERLPIEEKVGPSVPQLAGATKVLDGLKVWAIPQAQKLFDSKLSYLSKKKS